MIEIPVVESENESNSEWKSLIIPITTSETSSSLFIEIFPEEISSISSSTLIEVLKDEDAPIKTWADAALLYMMNKKDRESLDILNAACEREDECDNQDERVLVLASAGIAHVNQANKSLLGSSNISSSAAVPSSSDGRQQDKMEELRGMAEDRFNKATRVNQFFPMTWVGKGMLNLSVGKLDQARFFFDTTLKQCGQILPALLGMALVKYQEGKYKDAQEFFARVVKEYPTKSGAAVRVGFGLCCYKLGQVDRARSAFHRAQAMDAENVEAMIGCAILELASRDENTNKYFNSKTERAIKLISMANLIDHSNAMVQNHLANHYFWKWIQVNGTVSIKQGTSLVATSQPIVVEDGERIRIGPDFETYVSESQQQEMEIGGSRTFFHIQDTWKKTSATGLKLFKKDYERVKALAKGAYSSTSIKEIQAESLFTLARVSHVKADYENANRFYERACKLAPNLSPARFGLAQTLIYEEQHEESAAHLRLMLGTSSTSTDALALLGLLEIKTGKDFKGALSYLKRAVDLDPLNPELILLEALAMQQQETYYNQSLEKYKKAVELMIHSEKEVSFEIYANIGVLCHETKQMNDAMDMYAKALKTLEPDDGENVQAVDENSEIKHDSNKLFWSFFDAGVTISIPSNNNDDKDYTVKDEGRKDKGFRTLQLINPADESNKPYSRLKAGDHIRIGQDFMTEIVSVKAIDGENPDNFMDMEIKNTFLPIPLKSQTEDNSEDQPVETNKIYSIYIKKGNRRLSNPSAITIAFNIARLHETVGNERLIAAIELHKEIVKLHPAYVNSYLRLACIARDCGSIENCSEWLRNACKVAPGNAEVLTLVGNLHLSLCDWAPAQSVFENLLATKESNVEAYSQLSLGNIYFNNLNTPKKYTKHLGYAADFYRRILQKDPSNAFAANGLGTILAEKGQLFKAKDVFNQVRGVSGDTIPDALLNLGHIYLAQKMHPEALQMFQSYMNRTSGSTSAPVSCKSRDEDDAEVLLYIAFAYFDWARQTELFNNIKAAPADERYQKCIEYIELAMKRLKKENVILRYNWCRAKLQAANCVLQKITRNIRRSAEEVQTALSGIEESLPVVQKLLAWKTEGKKVMIPHSTLNDFISHCKANIESAKSHLSEELKKENEARELRELQRSEEERKDREKASHLKQKKEIERREINRREMKAKAKMDKVRSLAESWEHTTKMVAEQKERKTSSKKQKKIEVPIFEEDADGIFDNDVVDQGGAVTTRALFDDDSEDSSVEDNNDQSTQKTGTSTAGQESSPIVDTEKDLFGASSDEEESDEELLPASKRKSEDSEDADNKKPRVD